MVPQEVVLFLTLEVVLKLTLERPKSGTKLTLRHIYIYAFRPVCCLLFLAETTFFALLGGKEEDLRREGVILGYMC